MSAALVDGHLSTCPAVVWSDGRCTCPTPSVLTWTVTLDTPKGRAQLDVPTAQGSAAARRRAIFTAASLGWGDLDEISIVEVALMP